jgi:hypothetical protein
MTTGPSGFFFFFSLYLKKKNKQNKKKNTFKEILAVPLLGLFFGGICKDSHNTNKTTFIRNFRHRIMFAVLRLVERNTHGKTSRTCLIRCHFIYVVVRADV